MKFPAVALDTLNSELDPPLVHDPGLELVDERGVTYRVLIAGRREEIGHWGGWIEFYPADPELDPLRTDRDTAQDSYAALVRWAKGLDKVQLEAAFERAHPWQ
jgi:hypothetical protein